VTRVLGARAEAVPGLVVAVTRASSVRKLDGQRSEPANRVRVIFAIPLRKKTPTLVATDVACDGQQNRAPEI
jgi:hypothetical protein